MTKMKSCPECGGSGTLLFEKIHRQSPSRDIGFIEEYEEPCDNCGGEGKIEDDEEDEEELDHG